MTQTQPNQNIITIIDDDDAVRDSLTMLLDLHELPVRLFESGDAFLATDMTAVTGPVLLDVRMPGRDGLEVLPLALAGNPKMQIIMMSGHADIAMAVEALRRGAADFIEKPFQTGDLLAKLSALRVQDNTLAATPLTPTAAQQDARDLLANLTPRERDVMDGLVDGKANKIIAHNLGISVRTVETHRAKLLLKLGVRSLSDIVKISITAAQSESP